jgi:outer membrane cobalamin receptor
MEKTVKKLYVVLFVMVLAFASGPLFSQDATVDAETAVTREKATDSKEKVKATKAFEMGEIVVKDRAIANIEDASTTTEITDKDIAARSEKTLDESLRSVPGLNVSQGQKGQMGFTMRGFRQDKMAILVDGLPFEEIYDGGGGDISRIPVMNASKIGINRGGSSALYGARGTFGTINVITKKPEELFAELKAEYGQYQNYSINVAQGAPIGNFYYWFTATLMNSDGYKVSEKLDSKEREKWFRKLTAYDVYGLTYAGIYAANASLRNYINDSGKWKHTEYRKYYLSGKAGYNFTDDLEIGVSAGYYRNDQLFLGFYPNALNNYDESLGQWKSSPGNGNIFQQRAWDWPEDYRYDVAPYVNAEFGDLTVKANVFYVGQMNLLKYWNDFEHTSLRWDPSKHFENSYGFYAYPSYKLASWNKLSGAIHFRIEDFRKKEQDSGIGAYKTTKEMSASYVTLAIEDEMKFQTGAGDLALTAGVSYDAQSLDSIKSAANIGDPLVDGIKPQDNSMLWGTTDSLNPVLGVLYEPIKGLLRLRGAGSMKVEFPNLHQLSDNDSAGVDEELEPERSYNANAGFELMLLSGAVNFRSDFFYTRFDDKLARIRDDDTGIDYTMNIDGSEIRGFENTISGQFAKLAGLVDLDVSFSHVYIHARDLDDSIASRGEKVAETPEHQFVVQFLFEFITGTALNIWGQYKMNELYYVQKEDPNDAVEPYTTRYYKTVKLHDPLMVNIKISQKIIERFDVYVMCKNVFDDYNADPFNPGPGRMFYFGGGAKL